MEIEESWSIDDLLDAHEALDIQQEAEIYEMNRIKNEK